MVNTQSNKNAKKGGHQPATDTKQQPPPPKVYTQEDIDLIDEQYKEKEQNYQKFLEEAGNPLLNQYKKSLINTENRFDKEIIIYDKITGKWLKAS